ncbi:MAG: hypothetical protein KatS3mg003_1900 [Candidatus Nitrosocaldaceae archaeon]|nr:MAG: hypothetical protein KatS3mg003_1900 [Candidatus Nitrosocaldaceae archaeon]
MKNVDCSNIKKGRYESKDVYNMKLLLCKLGKRLGYEVEGGDVMIKAMKGDISNLSKLPYGIIIVKRGKGSIENIRNRFERALIEFRLLHRLNNVIIASFKDIEELAKYY